MKTRLKKIRLRTFAFILLLVYLVASFISSQFQLMTKKREYENTVQKQQELQTEVDRTRALLREGADRVYIEMVAREKLGYARPGEIIFVDIQSQ